MDFKEIVPERYRAKYDAIKDCFYVLDTWHPQIKNMAELTSDVPDDSPAMKIINGSEVNAIVGLLIKMGRFNKNEKIIEPKSNRPIIKNNYYGKKKHNDHIDSIVEEVIYRLSRRNRKQWKTMDH